MNGITDAQIVWRAVPTIQCVSVIPFIPSIARHTMCASVIPFIPSKPNDQNQLSILKYLIAKQPLLYVGIHSSTVYKDKELFCLHFINILFL